jgi:hypothetical protein
MRLLALVVVSAALAGCSTRGFTGGDAKADDSNVPLLCLPKHHHVPCARGVEQGRAYEFNLETHCFAWTYFDGRFWTPHSNKPPEWAGITDGTMVLERADLAIFRANQGGSARFVPAPRSYRSAPPTCL